MPLSFIPRLWAAQPLEAERKTVLTYQIKNAVRSMKRNPALSILLIAGIGLGIAVSTAFITTYYLMAGDPIPHKSDRLFYVEMDSWNPDRPYDDNHPERPPEQITYRDARGLMESDIPTHQGVMFRASLTVQPEQENEKPYREDTRMCFNDFFAMFEVPFLYGGPWSDTADENAERVAVINAETNRKLFGGEDSVGRFLRIENETYTITGVVDHWRPQSKYYDPNNFAFGEPEAIYLPFNLVEPLEIDSAGNDSNWKYYDGDEFADWLQSESVWLQMWVQLDTREQRDEYQAFLDAYAHGAEEDRPVSTSREQPPTGCPGDDETVRDRPRRGQGLPDHRHSFPRRLLGQSHRHPAGQVSGASS